MADLIATKSFTYNTRRLKAEDTFQAKPRDARILVAIGKAREAPAGSTPIVASDFGGPVIVDPPAVEDLAALRTEYFAVVGKRPFNGWDAETLSAKIADHKAQG